MARIRTVKPEYFQHEELGACSRDARLLGVALMQLADGQGRLRWVPRQVLAHAFPWDGDLSADDVERMVGELEGAGLVLRYEVEGRAYACFPSWSAHQRITGKEAQAGSRLPGPGEAAGKHPGVPPVFPPSPERENARQDGEAPGCFPGKHLDAQEQGKGTGKSTSSAPGREAPPTEDEGERIHALCAALGLPAPKPLQWPRWSAVARNPNYAEVEKLVEWAKGQRYAESAFLGCFDGDGNITSRRASRRPLTRRAFRQDPNDPRYAEPEPLSAAELRKLGVDA